MQRLLYNGIMKSLFAETLKAIRKGKGLSQGQFAEAIGISRVELSNWENDKAKPKDLAKFLENLTRLIESG